jgi:hypothetical protein
MRQIAAPEHFRFECGQNSGCPILESFCDSRVGDRNSHHSPSELTTKMGAPSFPRPVGVPVDRSSSVG